MYTAFRKSKHTVATFGKQHRENAVQPLLIGTSHCKLQILRAIFANSAQHSTRFFYGTMVCDTGVLSRVSWLVRPPVKLRVSIQFTLSLSVLKMHCDWRLASTQMSAGVSLAAGYYTDVSRCQSSGWLLHRCRPVSV